MVQHAKLLLKKFNYLQRTIIEGNNINKLYKL